MRMVSKGSQVMGTDIGLEATPVKNALVIFPLHQLYLPEFDAYGMLPSYKSYVITDSEDVRNKITDKVEIVDARFKVIPLGRLFTYNFSFIYGLENIITRIQPAVVFTYESYSTFTFQVSRLAKRFRFKHVIVSYETIPQNKALWGIFPITRYFHSIVRKSSGHFIALSKRVRNSLIASGIDEGRISTIYPGIWIPVADIIPIQTPSTRKFQILFMGRLRSNKGIVTMLNAFRLFSSGAPKDVELVVAGDGPMESVVREAVSRSNNIRFDGFVYGQKKENLLREADIFVYPSEDQVYPFGLRRWEEQTAAAVREAMAFALPVVVSDSGSLPELVGRKDVVFHQGNAIQLSEKIEIIHSSADFKLELSKFNLERSKALFSMQDFAYNLEKSFDGQMEPNNGLLGKKA